MRDSRICRTSRYSSNNRRGLTRRARLLGPTSCCGLLIVRQDHTASFMFSTGSNLLARLESVNRRLDSRLLAHPDCERMSTMTLLSTTATLLAVAAFAQVVTVFMQWRAQFRRRAFGSSDAAAHAR
jgi:hypothetical protein